MTEEEFKRRVKKFALDAVFFTESLPRSRPSDIFGRQLLRSASSVAANYRAACRGKSVADMSAKLGIVEEEADESILWIELLTESGQCTADQSCGLAQEADEIC